MAAFVITHRSRSRERNALAALDAPGSNPGANEGESGMVTGRCVVPVIRQRRCPDQRVLDPWEAARWNQQELQRRLPYKHKRGRERGPRQLADHGPSPGGNKKSKNPARAMPGKRPIPRRTIAKPRDRWPRARV